MNLKEETYLRINSAGAMPTLDVDGWILTLNAAMLNYLAASLPETRPGDDSPESRAEVNRWLDLTNADVHPALGRYSGQLAT